MFIGAIPKVVTGAVTHNVHSVLILGISIYIFATVIKILISVE